MLVEARGVEPLTLCVPRRCSPAELRPPLPLLLDPLLPTVEPPALPARRPRVSELVALVVSLEIRHDFWIALDLFLALLPALVGRLNEVPKSLLCRSSWISSRTKPGSRVHGIMEHLGLTGERPSWHAERSGPETYQGPNAARFSRSAEGHTSAGPSRCLRSTHWEA